MYLKFITRMLLLTLGIVYSRGIYAQDELSQDEVKQFRKELKALKKDLSRFKSMKEEDSSLEEKVSEKLAYIVQKKAELANWKQDLSKKDDGIVYLQEQLRKLQKDVGEVNATTQGRGDHDCSFSVQIGAYKNKDLTQYMDQQPNFGVEEGEGGFKKYTLGFFTSYWEAKSLSKYLNAQGAQTYVVGFYKGERIPDLKDMTQCTF